MDTVAVLSLSTLGMAAIAVILTAFGIHQKADERRVREMAYQIEQEISKRERTDKALAKCEEARELAHMRLKELHTRLDESNRQIIILQQQVIQLQETMHRKGLDV